MMHHVVWVAYIKTFKLSSNIQFIPVKCEQQAAGSTTLKEGLAIRYGLQMARQNHLHVDQLECDNKEVVECINRVITPGI